MILEIKIPPLGESIVEVTVSSILVKDGEYVKKNQVIAQIESDKVSLDLLAEESGVIKIPIGIKKLKKMFIGELFCYIDTACTKNNSNEQNLKCTKITKNDTIDVLETKKTSKLLNFKSRKERSVKITPLSSLRLRIAERLLLAKNKTAMLTTFNEIDMSHIINLKNRYNKLFFEKYGIKLGILSFFIKSCSILLLYKKYSNINSIIEGKNSVKFNYCDINIAVSSDKGLFVPVIKNCESLSISSIEKQIKQLSLKAKNFNISITEMKSGSFTITNGGVFGSMMSTPIINPPQSAILGIHNISNRAVVINNAIHIRPIMYIALSYDHCLIDGKESVEFLVSLKEIIENPINKLMDNNPRKFFDL